MDNFFQTSNHSRRVTRSGSHPLGVFWRCYSLKLPCGAWPVSNAASNHDTFATLKLNNYYRSKELQSCRKIKVRRFITFRTFGLSQRYHIILLAGKGGKNRRRGKNEKFEEKRELEFKMDGQGEKFPCCACNTHD